MSGWIQGENGNLDTKISEEKESAKISNFRTLHGDFRKFRKLILQLRIHFHTLRSKFTSWKINFACWLHHDYTTAIHFYISHVGVPISHGAKLSLSLMKLYSEGHIFSISAPNRTWFESLDSWLPELWNGIYNVENGLQEVLQKCKGRLQLCPLFSLPCFPLLHCSFLAYFERLRQRTMRLQSLVSS